MNLLMLICLFIRHELYFFLNNKLNLTTSVRIRERERKNVSPKHLAINANQRYLSKKKKYLLTINER